MNDPEFHDLLRGWLIDEAPREAPDWIVETVIGQTATLPQPRSIAFWRRWWLPAMRTLAVALAAVALVGLYTYRLRPADPTQADAPRVVRTAALGPGVALGMAALPDGVWVGNNSLAGVLRLDPETGETVASVKTYDRPAPRLDLHPAISDVTAAFGSIWTVDPEFGTVTRIDPNTNQVIATIEVGSNPSSAAEAAGALWVVSALHGTVSRIDPTTDRVTATAELPVADAVEANIAGDQRALWIAIGNELVRVDPRSLDVVARVGLAGIADGIAVDRGVWVATGTRGTVSKIDPESNRIEATIEIGTTPSAVTAANGWIWVTDRRDGQVRAIDPSTGDLVLSLPTGRGSTAMAFSGSWLSVLNQIDASVTLIDIGQ